MAFNSCLTIEQICDLMERQKEVWEGTPNAKAVMKDTCDAIAHELDLSFDEKCAFKARCGF